MSNGNKNNNGKRNNKGNNSGKSIAPTQNAQAPRGPGMTLQQVAQAAQAAMARGNEGQHRLGDLYNYVVQYKLAEETKEYKNAVDFFTATVKSLSRTTILLYGAVAKRFSQPVCVQHGMYKLDALVRYAEAANILELPPNLADVLVDVPSKKGDMVQATAFPQCTVKDLRRAILAKKAPLREPLPDQHKAQARLINSVLEKQVPKDLGRVTMRVVKGRPCFSVHDMPVELYEKLIEAMKTAMGPQSNAAVATAVMQFPAKPRPKQA